MAVNLEKELERVHEQLAHKKKQLEQLRCTWKAVEEALIKSYPTQLEYRTNCREAQDKIHALLRKIPEQYPH